ncbi:F0F1 ATP synthase subunit B' [Pseudoroseomonas rhizosphaerae]|uniref:ATP synthase subunit b n=1 Tax=Teichococcus rhizosphaerae TaxID=1335062 RepID=A0A2C7A5F7_9PROT|nr:F0F1 ATP synthase subunit B' [Pseudoroseomonas rhizosphaerae]PHK93580.1 F0F1 ATP synthase subunit B' [Pseudoroseomonas rhizosphaerae]
MQMMKRMTFAGVMAWLYSVGAHAAAPSGLEAQSVAAAEASGGGMPQLDFGNPLMLAQVVWLLIIFGVLYYMLANIALPRVASVLDERRNRIEGDLEAARAAKAEADAAMEAHQAATARARAESQAAIANAMQAAQAEAAARNAELNARLSQQIEAAEARINTARDAAMGALREVATDTANALVQRLTGIRNEAAVSAAVQRELGAQGQA